MSDFFAFLMGLIQGRQNIVLDSDNYTFTDEESDGNIVIEEDDT